MSRERCGGGREAFLQILENLLTRKCQCDSPFLRGETRVMVFPVIPRDIRAFCHWGCRERAKLMTQNPDRVFLSFPCQPSPKASLTDLGSRPSYSLTGGKKHSGSSKRSMGGGRLRGWRSGRRRKLGKKISSFIIWLGFCSVLPKCPFVQTASSATSDTKQ